MNDLQQQKIFTKIRWGVSPAEAATSGRLPCLVINWSCTKTRPKRHNTLTSDGKGAFPILGGLDWDVFHAFSQNLVKQKVEFQIAPYLRFEGLPGEYVFLRPSAMR